MYTPSQDHLPEAVGTMSLNQSACDHRIGLCSVLGSTCPGCLPGLRSPCGVGVCSEPLSTSLDQKKGSVSNRRVKYVPTGLVSCGNGFLNLDGSHMAPRLNSEIPSPPFSGPCYLLLPGCWSFPSHHPKRLFASSIKTT